MPLRYVGHTYLKKDFSSVVAAGDSGSANDLLEYMDLSVLMDLLDYILDLSESSRCKLALS